MPAGPTFVRPPLWLMHDMFSHTSYDIYEQSGVAHAKIITGIIDKYEPEKAPSIAEWGCGLARILRHLPQRFERYGFDYNPDAIRWCEKSIPGISFARNDLAPPLAAGHATFNAVYAISVFTHLSSENHDAWSAELWRVLKPDGVLVVSLHAYEQSSGLLPHERKQLDAGQLVVRGNVKEGSRTFVAYHPDSYVRNTLLSRFEILERRQELGQTLWIARK